MEVPVLTDAKNSVDFQKIIEEAKFDKVAVVHFWADWAPQCQQINDVLIELTKDSEFKKCSFVKVLAEELPEVSEKYNVSAVPTILFFRNNQLSDRLEGANVPELTKKIKQQLTKLSLQPSLNIPVQHEDLNTKLKRLVSAAPCMLFMKGTPEDAHCGFSKQIIALLSKHNARFSSFNILADDEVRQGLKEYSKWPTFPQLYINGELIGGIDILKEMDENGELAAMLPKKESINERLEKLVRKAPVMIFIKGSADVPRCGFSRTLVGILDETKIPYETFDILQDESARQGLKDFSSWPTFPQIYVNGSFIGGLDIIKELKEVGELENTLKGEQ